VLNTEAVRHIEFPRVMRRKTHGGLAATVVGVAERDEIVIAGMRPGHEQREIVRFGTGVGEIDYLKLPRHFRGEFLCV